MARPQEKPIFPTTYSPIIERNQDYENEEAAASGGGCFRRFCFGWGDEAESHNYLLRERGVATSTSGWVGAKLKQMKEFSEMAAGPRWKNFIRRIGKMFNSKKSNTAEFQYTPDSYALNFAGDGDVEEDGNLMHSFSSRFAPGYLINDKQRRAAAS